MRLGRGQVEYRDRLTGSRTSRPIHHPHRSTADRRRPERAVAPAWSKGPALRGGLERLIAQAFHACGNPNRTLCMSLEAPLAPAERLLALTGYEHGILWSPDPGNERSGVGAVHVLTAAGDARFAQIRDAAAQALQELVVMQLDGPPAPEPLVFGGFAFQPGWVDGALWRGFGDALFVLPRIAYTRRAGRAWLTLSAGAHELATIPGRARLAREAQEALRALRQDIGGGTREAAELASSGAPEAAWASLVTGIRGEIAAGRLEKAVAAQCTVVRGPHLPPATRVLERLRTQAPDCTRFALSVGNRTFLGASPERIVKRDGARVWTEALAGSARGDDAVGVESLLHDRKERAEHAMVAREIGALLGPLCATLSVEGPEVHRLRHVAHLRTRFEGILEQPHHVLDLVARLHPTPAVGGVPRAAALAWIAAHEPIARGLYAGPFGAFDRNGDGEFVVAIRSGLLAPGEAHLFAGAGIVEGSEVFGELCETRWKLRGLLSAIGIV
jgi:isochorismate synthase